MSKLTEKLLKAGNVKNAEVLSESSFFNKKDTVTTDLPILNIAFSGSLDGGLSPGLTIFAGESKSFKTMLGLYCLKAYFNKYDDAVCLFYDNEYGTTPDYLNTFGIDTSRIIHIPIEHVEQLKFDIIKRLEQIEKNDHVFILIDSLGALSSKKEIDDAVDEKAVTDMTRAKSIRSLLRIITPHLTPKNIPCIVVNHVYKTQEMFSKVVIPGGLAVTYSSNQIFVITKSQEKDGTELVGWNFTINIDKSRYVKERSKLPFLVKYEGGINKWSGLLDLALESGAVVKPNMGWFSRVNQETGEVEEKRWRAKDTNTAEFWNSIIKSKQFNEFVNNKFQVANSNIIQDEELDEEIDELIEATE